jgi:hypothetical protein
VVTRALVIAICAIGAIACGRKPAQQVPTSSGRGAPGLHVTLYRDHAVVAHRLEVVIPAASTTTVKLRLAAGVTPDDVYLVEKSDVVVREVRPVAAPDPRKSTTPDPEGCDETTCVMEGYEKPCCAKWERKSDWSETPKPPVEKPAAPIDVELVLGAAREGKFTMLVGYDTDKLAWDTAYTMTTTPGHDRVLLRGALAIRNSTGLSLRDAHVQVVDARHGTQAQRVTSQVGSDLSGVNRSDPNSTPIAAPREVGRFDVLEGDTRVELLPDAKSRPMRSVLVFDPVGTALDYPHSAPVQDRNLGVVPAPKSLVTESFEIDRSRETANLPGGPVRLFERRADGSMALLGESTLFGTATLAATVDTVAIGTATQVTGKRERRELTVDNDRKRVVEELAITIDNKRDRPVEVVLREHLYRGENWTIAYRSVFDIAKEGKQQIAMRIAVPAKQKQTVLYVVVYSWGT